MRRTNHMYLLFGHIKFSDQEVFSINCTTLKGINSKPRTNYGPIDRILVGSFSAGTEAHLNAGKIHTEKTRATF